MAKKIDQGVDSHRDRLGLPRRMKDARDLLANRRDRQFEVILDCIRNGSYIETACKVAGIGRTTFQRWCAQGNQGISPYAEFLEDLQRSQGESIMANLSVIDLAAARGDWRAAAWRLKTMYPHMYGDRVEVTSRKDYETGEPARAPRAGVDLSSLSLAEKKKLRELMSKAVAHPVIEVEGEITDDR